MTSWSVRRWARYGHERLYAETAGGTALGYLDLKTGRFHSDDLSNLPLLKAAIDAHLTSRRGTDASGDLGAAPTATRERRSAEAPPAWSDISGARPGRAAREQALAARAAQGRFTGFLARLFDVRTEERAWRIGADGEEAVAAQIATLGPQWRVLHAVRVGHRDADIDHVLIGPAGVFTVNAKKDPHASVWVGGDTVIVNGQRVPYVRNSRNEAGRASRLLTEHAGFPVGVVGVIAVVGARRGFTVKQQPRDGAVVVVARRRLRAYLQGLPTRLDVSQVEAIGDIARRDTTWR
ncbi:nuclease-related domain-containing protein [Cellulomonas sp. 179-A 9B4 NHS]|uniref:nuclease-related domain-containing protein n=1 Tax=Cellulomonas sp. 179-A 9B4 NHS TaxID=3142379 RepID=UPI0039A28DEE